MKIYTEIVIDMTTMEVVNEKSYEYKGDISHCGGGSSGGSSGKVDYPAHMKAAHQDWLNDTGADTMALSVVDLMNTAMTGSSPYSGYVPKDPDSAFLAPGNTLSSYISPYEHMKSFDEWGLDAAFDGYVAEDDANITEVIADHTASLDSEITDKVLPQFNKGKADLNATMSVAFAPGEALISDSATKKVAEADANIRLRRLHEGADLALRRVAAQVEWRRQIVFMSSELSRMYLASHGDRDDDYLEGLHKDGVWDLEMYQYGTQVMACISGAGRQVATPRKGVSKFEKYSGKSANAATAIGLGVPVGGGDAGQQDKISGADSQIGVSWLFG